MTRSKPDLRQVATSSRDGDCQVVNTRLAISLSAFAGWPFLPAALVPLQRRRIRRGSQTKEQAS